MTYKRILSACLVLVLWGMGGCAALTAEKTTVEAIATTSSTETSSETTLLTETTLSIETTPSIETALPTETALLTEPTKTTIKATIKTTTTAPKATAPGPAVVRVSIPEGFSFYQIANRLEQQGVCGARAFYDAAQAYQVQSFSVPADSRRCYHLEGFLYPDTYEFYVNSEPSEVLRRMLNNYAAKSGMPSMDVLILASIIEREARSTEHMAMVSSVFHNRLSRGMKLEADSTRSYVNQSITPSPWVANKTPFAELYNTYKCPALPAGPVCSPGRRAIEAARNPSQSDYLYFFFGNDNTNHYSRSFEEHVAKMNEIGVQYS
ncbi:MAG: endolytic transglycosylase MltG [Oscillospiraceae bacterium]|nr:endolytic transglycosylase MltG [Oscillospiraceae bacterium]